jgi:hypothetical protein
MTSKIIIVITAVVLIGVGFVAFQSSDEIATEVEVRSELVAENAFYDFGTIVMKDGIVNTDYKLTNTGNETVTIGKVYTSCMCTTATIIEETGNEIGKFGMPGHRGIRSQANSEVAPGSSVIVKAFYDPAAHGPSGVGLAQRSIYLDTDSTATPKIELRLKAMVTK